MQRLDGELDAGGRGVRQHRGDPSVICLRDSDSGWPGHGAADQHDQRRAQRRGFVDAAAVLVDRPGPAVGGRGREKAAATERHHREAVVADQLRRWRRDRGPRAPAARP